MTVRPAPNSESSPPPAGGAGSGAAHASQRARSLTHHHPREVALHDALRALADPVRRTIVSVLAASPDWDRACGTFGLPVGKATRSHHFEVLRHAGLIEQRDVGSRRLNRLRREEFDARFPGLLDLVLSEEPEEPAGGRAGR
ncbi:ArsR/SmtB family transcription factor [Streptomyces physcomitrii]|uniref:Helix-turn-helix transcriptional regulator n=1 Tax=Streptomyces physcomitrii TaxID=2724184 RepID=A0ABX1GVK5_9ACTN|nr:helix-turn-helix domain-containing protein [Streptomyces physcomitrii]NKI40121.1 helix-turn-helix transcriptional regulator [Streptomyces physcomitrii]